MDNEIAAKISSVINALNTIEVKGKTNLVNLGGCIAVLEDIIRNVPAKADTSKTE